MSDEVINRRIAIILTSFAAKIDRRIVELYDEGFSLQEIEQKMGLVEGHPEKILREFGRIDENTAQ